MNMLVNIKVLWWCTLKFQKVNELVSDSCFLLFLPFHKAISLFFEEAPHKWCIWLEPTPRSNLSFINQFFIENTLVKFFASSVRHAFHSDKTSFRNAPFSTEWLKAELIVIKSSLFYLHKCTASCEGWGKYL